MTFSKHDELRCMKKVDPRILLGLLRMIMYMVFLANGINDSATEFLNPNFSG